MNRLMGMYVLIVALLLSSRIRVLMSDDLPCLQLDDEGKHRIVVFCLLFGHNIMALFLGKIMRCLH